MGLFTLFGIRLARRLATQRFQAAPLSPQRLERRRVLDAGAAELLLGSLADTSDYVQAGDSVIPYEDESSEDSNIGPSNVELLLGASEILENDELQLGVSFEAPADGDAHTIVVNWGDGSPPETFVIEPDARFLGASHQYLDDNPSSTLLDVNTIEVTVFDAAGNEASATAEITVADLSPENVEVVPEMLIDRNGFATIRVTFDDIGSQDSHFASINWGDGSPVERVDIDPGARSLVASHQYPAGEPSDTFLVRVGIINDDLGRSVPRGTTILTRANDEPVLTVTDQEADEGTVLDLTNGGLATFSGLGESESLTATVDWGDGTPIESVNVNASNGSGTLDGSHTYLDNGTFEVIVVLMDGEESVLSESFFVEVNNVDPVLTVVADQVIEEGALLDLTDGRLGSFTDAGILDTHTALVFWGDGSAVETVTVDQGAGSGTLSASHHYADDGLYTVVVAVRDDDLGVTLKLFRVEVVNVDPTISGIDPTPTVDEGTEFTLADLGVRLQDPGFDNPLNPLFNGEVEETFTATTINWGDGSPTEALSVVNRVSGSPGVFTTADFDHAPHTYADNGLYTVTVTVADDDGELVERMFQIQVENVAPTLVLTSRPLADLEINEGETIDLFDLGEFFDPGFSNPLNQGNDSNGGEFEETFTYEIDWGDGTIETGQLPATVINGSVGFETFGTIVGSHQYLDNDLDGVFDNLYTITVTLSDDDGGVSDPQQIDVRVLNVDPTLEPIISATDVNTRGETTLTIEFADPGTEVLTVFIDWGDQLALPPDERFVSETFVPGPGVQTLVLPHTYSGPPDPTSPASDIVISVFIRDDDFGEPLVVDVGQSVTQAVAISNPGIGTTPIAIDTTPQVPRLTFPEQDDSTLFASVSSDNTGSTQTADLRTAVGDTKSTTDRFLELRVIDPATGEESDGFRLKPEVLNDLPGLFRTLPDNRYAIYLVRTETNTRRLVIEVYVRNGKLIDPGDDSEGTRDRPPTDEATDQVLDDPNSELPSEETPLLKPAQPEKLPAELGDQVGLNEAGLLRSRLLLGTTVVGLVASQSGRSWAQRIDEALAKADAEQWHRLRRRRPK